MDENEADIEVIFAPESEFKKLEPNYVPVNYGFFWTWWNSSNPTLLSSPTVRSRDGVAPESF